MMVLSDGRKSFPIGLAVLIQYRSVTDTQPASQPPSHVAVAITLNALATASSLKIEAVTRENRRISVAANEAEQYSRRKKKTFESLKDLQSRMMIIGKFVLAGCEAELAVISFLIRKNSENLLIAVLFYQVCADTVKAKQSKAQQNIDACYAFFCPSNKLASDLLTLKVVSESRARRGLPLCQF